MYLLKWFSIIDRHVKKYIDQYLAPYGINSSQHFYLLKICEEPGIAQDQLIETYHIHPSNITRALHTLEQREYVQRKSCADDKRKWLLYPTAKAQRVRKEILRISDESQALVLKEFSEEEQVLFKDFLIKAARNALFNMPF